MKIAYIMSRFPLLSETFILREMIEVEKLGFEIALYPLMCEDQPVVHKEAMEWSARANCIPFISSAIIAENMRVFLGNPFKYISLIWQIFWGNISSFGFLVKGLYLFPKAVYTARRLKEDNVEHIHAHYASHPALEAWIIHKLTGISYSIMIHSHDIYDCHAMLGPKLKDAAFLATISQYNIDYMKNLLGDWIPAKCHIVRCGIDPLKFVPVPKTEHDIFKILQIGTLHWKKGQVYLIQAMAKFREYGIPFRLQIIGEGEERANIEAEIRKYQLEDVVELLGAKTQSEVAQILPNADCYIQSSVSEGIPVAIMEAMACELPVVATRITGIPELVLHNKTGLLTESMDVDGMANALRQIKQEQERAGEMGKQGRLWVQTEFDLHENGMRLSKLFQSLAEKQKSLSTD
jgi:colanic acid/amylovoran biosynthesis glycosyltransferase